LATSPTLDLIQKPSRAAVLLHPLRLRLLEALREPGSATAVADKLGLTRQRANYHLRELEKEGLVELVEERRKGNCVERVFRATARHYLIAPDVLGDLAADPVEIQDRFSSTYLVAMAAQAIRDLGLVRALADESGKRLATFSLQSEISFASVADRNAFAEELANLVARLVARYHDEDTPAARPFKMFLGVYPGTTRETEPTPQPEEIDR
jgi:DNA-binding transcriptional ArsR family regulator